MASVLDACLMVLVLGNLTPGTAGAIWQPEPVRRTASLTRLECVSTATAELEVTSADPFPVRNALTVLEVGPVVSSLSRYPDSGDLHGLIFTLTRDQLNSVSSDDQAVVRFEPTSGSDVWLIGSIDPSTAVGCDEAGST